MKNRNHITQALILASALSVSAQFTDTLWHDIFGGATGPRGTSALNDYWMARASNWSVRYPNTDSAAIYGSTSTSVNTFLIYKQLLADFEFEVTQRLPGASTNSGVQVRSTCYNTSDAPPCGAQYRVCGPQADLGHTHNGEFFAECGNALVNVNTTHAPTTAPNFINNTTTQCRQTQKQYPQWNVVRVRLDGPKAIGWMNEVKCFEYTITNSAWLGAGIFALQYHTGSNTNVEYKSIKLKMLNVVTGVSRAGGKEADFFSVANGPGQSLRFDVRDAGDYSFRLADLNGVVQKSFKGRGPVSNASVHVGTSGLFVVHVTTPAETYSKLVHVR